jgi:hypothetical protein
VVAWPRTGIYAGWLRSIRDSGFLSDEAYYLLLDKGIPDDHIYRKGNAWSQDAFLAALEQTLARYDALEGLSQDHATGTPILEVAVDFVDFHEANSSLVAFSGQEYQVVMAAVSVPIDTGQRRWPGRKLLVYLHIPGSSVSPKSQLLTIPEAGQTSTATFKIVFHPVQKDIRRTIRLLVYFQNHLVRLIETQAVIMR